jgi:hypothetical protein
MERISSRGNWNDASANRILTIAMIVEVILFHNLVSCDYTSIHNGDNGLEEFMPFQHPRQVELTTVSTGLWWFFDWMSIA